MRTRRGLRSRSLASLLLVAVLAAGALAAEKKGAGDRYWTAPDLASYGVSSIALLPPATYDGNLEKRKLVESAVGQALKGTGYRWASPFRTRDSTPRAGAGAPTRALTQ